MTDDKPRVQTVTRLHDFLVRTYTWDDAMTTSWECPKCHKIYTTYIKLTAATCRNPASHSSEPAEMVPVTQKAPPK